MSWSPHRFDPDAVASVANLIGDRVRFLSDEWPPTEQSGGDLDCAVEGLDQFWPLRLPPEWRLRLLRRYDFYSYFWLLEKDRSSLLGLDCTEDPKGVGRYGFRTTLATRSEDWPRPDVLAAYFTAKRLRKNSSDWARVYRLAERNPVEYRSRIHEVFGTRLGNRILDLVRDRRVPDDRLRRQALIRLFLYRFGSPTRAFSGVTRGAGRWAFRLAHPTGLTVNLVGPDGTGKSSIAQAMPEVCEGLFLRYEHSHWRPGLLPRLGRISGSDPVPTDPHSRLPHGKVLSLGVLGYYWLDFLVGGRIRWNVPRFRTGISVIERGWWDMAVDPRRYRVDVPPWITRLLGRLLPRPDLVVILGASPEVLLERKQELDRTELERQLAAWGTVLPPRQRRVIIDASKPLDEVTGHVRAAIVDLLEGRARTLTGVGWFGVPRRSSPRFILPRGPKPAVRSSLLMYQPVTPRGLLGWTAARYLAGLGGMRLLPRAEAPPPEVTDVLQRWLPRHSTYAVATTNHPQRFVALIVREDGEPLAVAKVATDTEDKKRVESEGELLQELGPLLPPPLRAPSIIDHEPGVLITEALPWRARAKVWKLDPRVAKALGSFARAGGTGNKFAAHGDFAPWNLLSLNDGWGVVDWELGSRDAPPFYDLLHFLVQSSALLKRPRADQLVRAIGERSGWIGDAIDAYARGAQISPPSILDHLTAYVDASRGEFIPDTAEGRRGSQVRQRLLHALDG